MLTDGMLNKKNFVGGGGRNYGIDLLRVFSMFMVVLLHVNNFPGLLSFYDKNSLGYIFVWLTEAFAICAVNVYAVISGYVLLNSKFKLKRILQLYLEVLFFNFLSYVLIIVTKGEWSGVKEFIKGIVFILPLSGNNLWYFKAYFLLFFTFPLLNILVKNMNKRQFILLFSVIFVFLCVISPYRGYTWYIANGYSFIWLVAMYFIGAYFKKFGLFKVSAAKSFIIYCILSICILLGLIINNVLPPVPIDTYDTYAYTSVLVVLQAIFLFNSFAKLQINSRILQKSLLFVSPLTFGVYIIHCTGFGRGLFKYLTFITDYSVWLIIPLTIGCALLIFIVCALIEWLKQVLFKYSRIDKLTDITGDFIQNKISAFAEKRSV